MHGIIEYGKTLGFIIRISFSSNFASTRGRFPDLFLAYSISMEGKKVIMPSTAFATTERLEQDIRCRYFKPALALSEAPSKKAPKSRNAVLTYRPNMVGAKALEMKFAKHGLVCNILPATTWQRTRIAALRIGQDPAKMWGISIYDQYTGTWDEIEEVYFTLRNVAGALSSFLKHRQ